MGDPAAPSHSLFFLQARLALSGFLMVLNLLCYILCTCFSSGLCTLELCLTAVDVADKPQSLM